MVEESYEFGLGKFQCLVLCDGAHTYEEPAFLLFPHAPREPLVQALHKHNLKLEEWTSWVSPYNCLLINTGSQRVLVDTGAGGTLGPDTGKLLKNLEAQGISPGDINTVLLTHGHPDHIGGNTINGGKIAFPNARFVMSKEEWNFWTSEKAKLSLKKLEISEEIQEIILEIAREKLLPIQSQLDLIDQEKEIVPGIRAVFTPGHTPGHIMPVISSEGKELFYVSDALIHPIHIERPQWYMATDISPEENINTRHNILEIAAKEKALVHAFHFPFPGLGHIAKEKKTWQWQPIKSFSSF